MRNHTIFALAACLSLAGAACKQANRTDQRSQDNQAKLSQPERPQAQPPQAQPPQAQPAQQPAEQAAQAQPKQGTVSGSVRQVGANDITVGHPGGGTMHIFVDSTVPVTLDGQQASLGEIPAGAQAVVIFTTQGDLQKAQRIDAQTKQPVRGTEESQPQPKEQRPDDEQRNPPPNDQRPNDQPPSDQPPNDQRQP